MKTVICAIKNPKEFYWALCYQMELSHPKNPPDFFRTLYAGINEFDSRYRAMYKPVSIFVNIHGWIQNKLDKKVNVDVIKLNNNYLTFLPAGTPDEVSLCVERLQSLNKITDEVDSQLIFILFPKKIHKRDSQLPRGMKNLHSHTEDLFLDLLAQQKKNAKLSMEIYDCRKMYQDNPEKHYQLFYKGDHHWQPQYAFNIFLDLLPLLRFKYPYDFSENANPENYFCKTIPVHFPFGLGSQERRTGIYYAHCNDVKLEVYPKFKTDFETFVEGKDCHSRGDFQTVMVYHGIDDGHRRAINHLQKKGKILIIKDSFALPLFDYLALTCRQIDMIDLRLYKDSVHKFIQKEKPDIVIVGYSVTAFTRSLFDFDKNESTLK